MSTKKWAIGLVLLCTLFTSFAQVFFKFGADKLSFDFFELTGNYNLWLGLALYAAGAVLLLAALKHGELSVLYPFVATSYIWVSFLSAYFFSEQMNAVKWMGVAAIIFGVSFIGIGSKHKLEKVK